MDISTEDGVLLFIVVCVYLPHYGLLSKVLMEQKGRTHQKGQQGLNLALPENYVAYLQIHFMSALPHTSDSTIIPLFTLLFVPIFNHIRMYVLTYSTLEDLLLHITHSLSALACATSTFNSLSTHSTFPSPPSPPQNATHVLLRIVPIRYIH